MKPITMSEDEEKAIRASADEGGSTRAVVAEVDALRTLIGTAAFKVEVRPIVMSAEQEKSIRERAARAEGDPAAALVLRELDAMREEFQRVAIVGVILLSSCESMEAYASEADADEKIIALVANQNRMAIQLGRAAGLRP